MGLGLGWGRVWVIGVRVRARARIRVRARKVNEKVWLLCYSYNGEVSHGNIKLDGLHISHSKATAVYTFQKIHNVTKKHVSLNLGKVLASG